MPYVSDPWDGGQHTNPGGNCTFTWLDDVGVYSCQLLVGYSPGSSDIYIGNETQGLSDPNVSGLPGGGTLCYTRVNYRMVPGGAWYAGPITSFTCN